MNFELSDIPQRTRKPRQTGLTMMMDKGLSLRQAEDFLSVSADYCDLIKLGFGTSYITPNLKEKIKLYRDTGMKVYLGGTLFEAFLIRGMFDEYLRLLDKFGLNCVEVSDGSIQISHDLKCEYISLLAKYYTVLSEVGSKESGILIHPRLWKNMMQKELDAGSWKVIAEARESGTVGIFRPSGKAHVSLVKQIVEVIPKDSIIWEAPQKSQQVWFIKELGANVNLGNIGYEEIIPLETLRLGLRGDTFMTFISNKSQVIKTEPREPEKSKPKNKMKEITVQELKAKLDAKENIQVIDCREPYEYEIANINAELIPLGEIMDNIHRISRDKPVIIHCRSGARSANIIQALEAREGFTNLYNLKGGILAWADEIDNSVAKY